MIVAYKIVYVYIKLYFFKISFCFVFIADVILGRVVGISASHD